ncbi:TPA: hypothetical protein ACNH0M_001036 [Morganella morganii]
MSVFKQLKLAQERLERIEKKWSDYSGNNPSKYSAELKSARRDVREQIKKAKLEGLIELTESEKTERELNKLYPNAKSKKTVEYKQRKYIKKYYPLEKSRSGKTVTEWGSEWCVINEKT